MSERIRKGIGIGLVLISTALCVAGIFPLPQKETAAYEGGRSGKSPLLRFHGWIRKIS